MSETIVKLKTSIDNAQDITDNEKFIYSLFDNGSCIYVGQTACLKNRILQHICDGKDFDEISYFVCNKADANISEADEIVRRNPTLNKTLPPTDKYIGFSVFRDDLIEALKLNDNTLGISFTGLKPSDGRLPRSYLTVERSNLIIASIIKTLEELPK